MVAILLFVSAMCLVAAGFIAVLIRRMNPPPKATLTWFALLTLAGAILVVLALLPGLVERLTAVALQTPTGDYSLRVLEDFDPRATLGGAGTGEVVSFPAVTVGRIDQEGNIVVHGVNFGDKPGRLSMSVRLARIGIEESAVNVSPTVEEWTSRLIRARLVSPQMDQILSGLQHGAARRRVEMEHLDPDNPTSVRIRYEVQPVAGGLALWEDKLDRGIDGAPNK